MPRIGPPRDPVTIHLDGDPIVAERGEPAVVALIAAGRIALARSPKFHRPRGPACLRAACDGCLARVDGLPNVMTCRVPAADGMRIETQNVVGSRETDLLRVADWFFPEGMNHHELFAGVPGVQRVMQVFARRVAGLGRLPSAAPVTEARVAEPPGRPALGAEHVVLPANSAEPPASGPPVRMARRAVDALVIGSGPSGMAVALELAARGRQVEVLDDDLTWGGSARILESLPGRAAGPWASLLDAFGALVASGRVVVRVRTTAAGIYGDDVLVASEGQSGQGEGEGAPAVEVLNARTLVLAPGAHDGVLAFEGNDVPGVMSARAACRLLALGVHPGARVVVAAVDGGGPFGDVYAHASAASGHAGHETRVVREAPVRVRGSGRVKGVVFATRELACDTLVVDAPRAPAYELCAQAGGTLRHEARGFVVVCDAGGRVRDGVFAAGEAVGTPLDPSAVRDEARELAARA